MPVETSGTRGFFVYKIDYTERNHVVHCAIRIATGHRTATSKGESGISKEVQEAFVLELFDAEESVTTSCLALSDSIGSRLMRTSNSMEYSKGHCL